jgi:RNA ligase (TIGR02306 family)
MRKMVTIREVADVLPIEGADKIELIQLDGWQCVSGKGNFKPSDLAVYFEIDSFLPCEDDARFEFLKPKAIHWNGRVGARIKTIKLRGQLSQGLVLPLAEFPEIATAIEGMDFDTVLEQDFSDLVGVAKWEPILNAQLAGKVRGNFPHFIRKTDQERLQNILKTVRKYEGDVYEVTVKLDGSSMTAYVENEEERFGVCSRNLDLTETEDNAFWKTARKLELEEALRAILEDHGVHLALQGELIGPGIQGNNEGLDELDFFVFDIWDIDNQTYLDPADRHFFCAEYGLKHAPFLENVVFTEQFETLEAALAYASGPSLDSAKPKIMREGVVFKSYSDPNFSFKIISNEYLLKHGDR